MRYTELFYSVQGEGRFVGVPSVFLRVFGCNLRCPHFAAHNRVGDNPEVAEITKNIDQYKSFEELPLVKTGCDTYASVYPQFKRFAKDATPAELAERMAELIKHEGEWHLVITGGEPLLIGNQKNFIEMLRVLKDKGLKYVTFETNGTQTLLPAFALGLGAVGGLDIDVTFSVSPKLSSSGEDTSVTIIPDMVVSYQEVGHTYLKFVVTSEDDLIELREVIQQYRDAGFNGAVYLMPAGGCVDEYLGNRQMVSKLCMENGFRYSPRLHVDLFGNSWGT